MGNPNPNPIPILHPQLEALRVEIRSLRDQLAALIDEEDVLRFRVGPYLQSLYDSRLGPLELELLELRVSNAALRRRIELLRARANHGEPITEAFIHEVNAKVEVELEEWFVEVKQREQEVADAQDHDRNFSVLSPEVRRKAKSLYRELAKRLHPDIVGEESPEFQRYWDEVCRAYKDGDVDILEAILAVLVAPEDFDAIREEESARDTLERLRDERDRLKKQVERQMDRIVELRRKPPFCYERELSDAAWIAAKRTELRKSITAEKEARVVLEAEYERLAGWRMDNSVH